MITAVERDDLGIRVTYDAVPPVGFSLAGLEARPATTWAMSTAGSPAISGATSTDGVAG